MAKIWYAFFDSTPEDKRLILAEDWARFNRSLFTDGIRNGGDCFEVTAGPGLSVNVNFGLAVLQGYIFRVDDDENEPGELVNLILPAANMTYDRIDRIVIRLDRRIERRDISLNVKMGIAAANPVPPELERNDNIWELSVAQVKVGTRNTHVLQSDITDERFVTDVCGLINSVIQLDPSSWQRQVDENIAVQNAKTDAILDGWIQFMTAEQNDFAAWLVSTKHDLAETALYDFDNLAAKSGMRKTTVFDTNTITATIRNTVNNAIVAQKIITFVGDSSVTANEKIYDGSGTVLKRNTTVTTTFNADGSITEVVV